MRDSMSALPPKADMCGATRDVRFVPIADIPHLVTTAALIAAVDCRLAQRASSNQVSAILSNSAFSSSQVACFAEAKAFSP